MLGHAIYSSPTHFLFLIIIANCFTHLKREKAQASTPTETPLMTLLGDIISLLRGSGIVNYTTA